MDQSKDTMASVGRVYLASDILKRITIPRVLKMLEATDCISIRYLPPLDIYELVLISPKYFEPVPMYVMLLEVEILRAEKNEKFTGVPEYMVGLNTDSQGISVISMVEIMGEKERKK